MSKLNLLLLCLSTFHECIEENSQVIEKPNIMLGLVKYTFSWTGILICNTGIAIHIVVFVPIKDLDFIQHILWYLLWSMI